MPFGMTQLFAVLKPSAACFVCPSRETKMILVCIAERSAHALTVAAVSHFSPARESVE